METTIQIEENKKNKYPCPFIKILKSGEIVDKDDLLNKYNIHSIDFPSHIKKIIENVIENKKHATAEIQVDGIWFYINFFYSGNNNYVNSLFFDITGYKTAEQELFKQNKRLAILTLITEKFNSAKSIEELIEILVQSTQQFGYIYSAFYEKKGNSLKPQKIYGLSLNIFTPLKLIKEEFTEMGSVPVDSKTNIISRVYREKKITHTDNIFDYLIDTPAENFYDMLNTLLLPFKIKGYTAVPISDYGVFTLSNPFDTDVSENTRLIESVIEQLEIALEREKIKLEKEEITKKLFESEKNALIGKIAGGIAHDLNNILTTIKGNFDLLYTETPGSNNIDELFKEINTAISNAKTLTEKLLILSRKKTFISYPIVINKIIENSKDLIKNTVGENTEVEINLEPNLWEINSNEKYIEEIFLCLLTNAKERMEENKKIFIKTENMILSNEDLKNNNNSSNGKFVCITFTDTGKSPESNKNTDIFEPFHNAGRTSEGRGMELAVLQSIVREHNGWVEFKVNSLMQNEFRIFIPSLKNTVSSIFPENNQEKKIYINSRKVLVVEDESSVRNFAVRVLKKYNYNVISAENKKQTLEIFSSEIENISIIFTDLILPDGNGFELYEYIKEIKPDIKFIFTSGYPEDKIKLEEKMKEGIIFLQKPYEINKLIETIKILLQENL